MNSTADFANTQEPVRIRVCSIHFDAPWLRRETLNWLLNDAIGGGGLGSGSRDGSLNLACDTAGMPCRYFEPLQIVAIPFHRNARLPLINEYDGSCHASPESAAVPAESRFAGCNHGNRDNPCGRFPASDERIVLRFTISKESSEELEVLAIEEANHRPIRWQTVRFVLGSEELWPDRTDICQRAQILAFCRSYVTRAAGQAGSEENHV
jgi:hypothetical protein